MVNAIQEYIAYLHDVRKIAYNTEVSYERDLKKAASFLEDQEITDVTEVTETSLNSYILFLEGQKMSPATVSRSIASLRSFFRYLLYQKVITDDPTERLKPPKVEKHLPSVLTVDEIALLLKQPNTKTMKGLRDRAMLALIYATGIRVSELIHLTVGDVDLQLGYIVCKDEQKERRIPMPADTQEIVEQYMTRARQSMLKGRADRNFLFLNCQGTMMSRQGFWKLLKGYAQAAGIEKEITPHTLRHSYAMHQYRSGQDIKIIQQMLGHADLSTTQSYVESLKES